MKKRIIICIVLLIGILGIIGFLTKRNPLTGSSNLSTTNSENLYDIAIQYIIDNDSNPEKDNERYKSFTEYKEFGIYKDKNYRYVYMWISEESFYIKDNKIISGSGSSMPYKFTFKLAEDEVVKYELPRDGNEYITSIKEMYPDDIENKVIDYTWDSDEELIKKVKEYYSDLSDNNIYFLINDTYVKADK